MQGGEDFPGSRPPIRERRNILPYVLLAIILIIIIYAASTVWLNWTVLESMYRAKAGLDWFSINYYGGLTFVVAGLLALLFVNPIPRRSDLLEAFNALMGLQYRQSVSYGGYGQTQRRIRPVYIRPGRALWAFWQFLKWVILFGIFTLSNGFPAMGNITIVADMALKGFGSTADVGRIAVLPLFPASGNAIVNLIPTMEIQYRLITYVLTVLMIVIALRFFLKFVRDVVIRAGDKWIRNIFIVLSAIVFSIFIGVPYWAMDVTIPYEWGIVATILLAFIVLAVFYQIKSTRESIPLAQRRRTGVVAATIFIAALLIFNVGAFTYYRINFNNNYVPYQWNPLVQKQETVSRWSAGIQNINYTGITNIPSGNASKTLSLIRQWDSLSAQRQSQNNIGVNYLQLVTPPEIVYLNGHEYWVSPTTFQYPDSTDWIATHLIYTHSSKIIMMDTHTGDFVKVSSAFGLTGPQPLMYYGEDNNVSNGYMNDVYVHVNGYQEIEGVSYSGAPDYTLCGAQRTLWFLNQFQFGFALTPPQDCIQVLHDREVFQRVQNILISGLSEDNSAYIVSDGTNLYFAIQIYINYPLQTGFSATPFAGASPNTPIPYMRFFGVVLVNIANGNMQGYTVAQNDNFLASFYKQYYPSWTSPPAWLQKQMRYPEQLLGNFLNFGQLDADFVFHVTDPFTFRGGNDFFERPSGTEVLYIPFVIGNNVSFAAVQLVEFQQSAGKNLAGLYVVYGGDQLGQFDLYQANVTGSQSSVPLLGPTAATNAFQTDQATKQQLTLTQAAEGNILLYPINGHLYYFIPAYIYQQSGTSVVARNPFIDVIDAQNASAPVRLIQTSSTTASDYGFNIFVGTNGTLRLNYVLGLFAAQHVTLQNATITNSNIVDNLGTVTYTSDTQNQSATTFVNNFINNYFKNTSITGGGVAFQTVYYWEPSAGTIDFGFLVANNGISKLYTFTLLVGQ